MIIGHLGEIVFSFCLFCSPKHANLDLQGVIDGGTGLTSESQPCHVISKLALF
jgi:hypothetical protein